LNNTVAAVEETEDELEPIELLLRGKTARSSRGSSEDRSSSRGSSVNRHVLPTSKASAKEDDHVKYVDLNSRFNLSF